jgi:TRAP transporter TAXI family solute receptor
MEQTARLAAWGRLLSAVLMIIPGVLSGLAGGGLLAGCLLLNVQAVRRLQRTTQSIPKGGQHEQEIYLAGGPDRGPFPGLTMGTSGQAAETLKMATIAPGSSAYLTMTTMATMINQAQDELAIKVDATGAATKHMIDLAKGKIDLCMTNPVIYAFMKKQKAMYKKVSAAPELAKNLRLLFWFPYGQYHFVTYADAGIKELKDMKGKRVFLGPPGGGAWNASREWVEATTGMKPNKDFDNVKGSWSSAFQGFQDRQFDVYVAGGIAPFPQVEQLALTSKLHLLGLNKKNMRPTRRPSRRPPSRDAKWASYPPAFTATGWTTRMMCTPWGPSWVCP